MINSPSNFSDTGLTLSASGQAGMTYLYGLSDFFTVMFEDKDVLELALEANAVTASNIYSRFLQATSSVSLETVQAATGTTIKLLLINSRDLVAGTPNQYRIPYPIQASGHLSNRPFLPTYSLDAGVDFNVEQADLNSSILSLAKPLSSHNFSSRPMADGSTQYAVWFVDALVDEQNIYKAFGKLIGIAPDTSSEMYSNFVYGLYYLYTHGPSLQALRRGLNLVLGVPLARDAEEILDVRLYAETGQYLIITAGNQYLIPYGLKPSVSPGDTLSVGQELSQWVEIKDYTHDGAWWINLRIPEWLVPTLPGGQPSRYATVGSHLDYVMRTYLRNHAFLIRVNVNSFKNIQQFSLISDVSTQVKPAYTQPIYVWAVTTETEYVNPKDDDFHAQLQQPTCEHAMPDFGTFRRGPATDDPTTHARRGCATFHRWMGTPRDAIVTGYPVTKDSLASYVGSIGGMDIAGIINPMAALKTATDYDKAIARAVCFRGSPTWNPTRSKVGHLRGEPYGAAGKPSLAFIDMIQLPIGFALVPLYVTGETDVANKCRAAGYEDPTDLTWVVEIIGPHRGTSAINNLGINRGNPALKGQLRAMYSLLMVPDYSAEGPGFRNPDSLRGWRYIPKPSDIADYDYIVAVRTVDRTFGVYWATSNLALDVPHFVAPTQNDSLVVEFTDAPSRLGAFNCQTPYYFLRGAGGSSVQADGSGVNQAPINQNPINGVASSAVVTTLYSDELNTNITATRGPVQSLRPPIRHRIRA
jgi:hypothetical protein